MNYSKQEIKPGITIHKINTNKFKTNLYSVFLATPLTRENVTKNALMAAVIRRGSKENPTQEIISQKLEEMYGATFDCGIEKSGDNQIIKFYMETINEEFLPEKEKLTKKSLNILFDIIFNPLVENDGFKAEYVENEKQNLKQIIESKIDNKRVYSYERCVEEMFKGLPHGLYTYGYVEDLEEITPQSLYKHYKDLINSAKIDIFASGEFENSTIVEDITENEKIKSLKERKPEYIVIKGKPEPEKVSETKTVEEHMRSCTRKSCNGIKRKFRYKRCKICNISI